MPGEDPLGDAIDSLYARYKARYEIGLEAETASTGYGCSVVSGLIALGVLSRFNFSREVDTAFLTLFIAFVVLGGINVAAKRRSDKKRIAKLARDSTEADKRRWAFVKVLHDRRVERLAAEPGEQEFKYFIDRSSDSVLAQPAERWLRAQESLKTDGLTIPESIKKLHEGVQQKTDETLVDLLLMAEKAKTTEDREAVAAHADEICAKFDQVAHEVDLSIKSFAASDQIEGGPSASIQSLEDRLSELRHIREAVTEMEAQQKLGD